MQYIISKGDIMKKLTLITFLLFLFSSAYGQDYSQELNSSLSIDLASHVVHNQSLSMIHTSPNSEGKLSNCFGLDGSDSADYVCDFDTSVTGDFSFDIQSSDQLGLSGVKTVTVKVDVAWEWTCANFSTHGGSTNWSFCFADKLATQNTLSGGMNTWNRSSSWRKVVGPMNTSGWNNYSSIFPEYSSSCVSTCYSNSSVGQSTGTVTGTIP